LLKEDIYRHSVVNTARGIGREGMDCSLLTVQRPPASPVQSSMFKVGLGR
jgi:hypothetical protein